MTCLGLCEGVICIVGSIRFPCTWLGLYGPKVHGVWALAKVHGVCLAKVHGVCPFLAMVVCMCACVWVCVCERERERKRERESRNTQRHIDVHSHIQRHTYGQTYTYSLTPSLTNIHVYTQCHRRTHVIGEDWALVYRNRSD